MYGVVCNEVYTCWGKMPPWWLYQKHFFSPRETWTSPYRDKHSLKPFASQLFWRPFHPLVRSCSPKLQANYSSFRWCINLFTLPSCRPWVWISKVWQQSWILRGSIHPSSPNSPEIQRADGMLSPWTAVLESCIGGLGGLGEQSVSPRVLGVWITPQGSVSAGPTELIWLLACWICCS